MNFVLQFVSIHVTENIKVNKNKISIGYSDTIYILLTLKIYSICNVNYRFSILKMLLDYLGQSLI